MVVALISFAHPPGVTGSWGRIQGARPVVIGALSVRTLHSSVPFSTGDEKRNVLSA